MNLRNALTRTLGVALLCLSACAPIAQTPLDIAVTPEGILGNADDARIHWSCNISQDDKTLCRGRADRSHIALHYMGHPPVTAQYRTVMLYRSAGRIVGLQLHYLADSQQAMYEAFGSLVENRYDTSLTPVARACGKNDAVTAIAQAQADINTPEAGICSDVGDARVSWRFYVFMDSPDAARRLVQFTVRAPGLQGPDSWWF